MANAREKGKIPHGDWSAIRTRHAAGESLASIARDYGCTGPAIRYIINRPTDHPASNGDAREEAAPPPAAASVPAPAPESVTPDPAPARSPGIDPELRWRVSSEIASFLTEFDSFLTSDSPARYDALLAATDRLMRIAARTHIELERARAADQTARTAKAGPRG